MYMYMYMYTYIHMHTYIYLVTHKYCFAESASSFLFFGPRSVVSRVLAPCLGALHSELQHELQPLATNLPLGARTFAEQHLRIL